MCIRDSLGGGGLSCAISETAESLGIGIELDVQNVHLRESDLLPEEIEQRRLAMQGRGSKAWKPKVRQRVVSEALQAYALMATSASDGAVRVVPKEQDHE